MHKRRDEKVLTSTVPIVIYIYTTSIDGFNLAPISLLEKAIEEGKGKNALGSRFNPALHLFKMLLYPDPRYHEALN